MAEDDTHETGELSTKQQKFVDALLIGANSQTAALTAGVSESTAVRWQKSPAVKLALKTARQELFTDRLALLREGVTTAIKTLLRNMGTDVPPYVQVMSASKWLDVAVELYRSDLLEERLQAIEERLKDVK
jgi:phage terminase small subunit